MVSKRDHYQYKLNQERTVVHYGTTKDSSRKVNENPSEGKKFTNVVAVGPALKKDTAINWEE